MLLPEINSEVDAAFDDTKAKVANERLKSLPNAARSRSGDLRGLGDESGCTSADTRKNIGFVFEVIIDEGFGHVKARRDRFDTGPFEAMLEE